MEVLLPCRGSQPPNWGRQAWRKQLCLLSRLSGPAVSCGPVPCGVSDSFVGAFPGSSG